MRALYFVIIVFLFQNLLNSQQTVGTFLNLENSYNGYTLISPSANNETYLINNCGQIINQWSSDYHPGMAAYLLENGNLLRTARIGGSFSGGGIGGRIEMYSWDGTMIWSYNHATQNYHQHHDIEFLPNGNILILAWERRSQNEAIEQGRNPSTLSEGGLWPEQIIEVKPVNSNEIQVIWEWHVWDHLVQDFDSVKPNFGVISEHPELLDLNIVTGGGGGGGASTDWIHANSIDYNPVLDQIVISSRTLNELFVIDHSTTSEEAASHSGGNYGKGGDFLYRWGNPALYGRGTFGDQRLFGQHDVHWIPYNLVDGGQIMVFNNGGGRPSGTFSSIDVIKPPLDQDGSYIIEEGKAYGPTELLWSYVANPPSSFYAVRVSGAQRQPNGNTLICDGPSGSIFELDENFNTVWSYVSPVNAAGPVSQGISPGNNPLFRAYRYGPDYPAFEGIDLVPGEFLEASPIDFGCKIHSGTSSSESELNLIEQVYLISNPVDQFLNLNNDQNLKLELTISDLNGKLLNKFSSNETLIEYDVSNFNTGLYILQIVDIRNHKIKTEKFIKI